MTTHLALIIGAPKCGTSSLFRWLCQHPEICGTEPKETYLLLRSSHPLSRRPSGRQYRGDDMRHLLQVHARAKSSGKILLEATTHNLYEGELALECQNSTSPVKAIVLLRHPSDRILSSFLYTKHNLGRISRRLTFSAYVEMILSGESAKLHKFIANPASRYVLLRELSQSSYATHLATWYEALGRENVGVWISEDIFRDPSAAIEEVAKLLGVAKATDHTGDFEKHNRTERIGSARLQRMARQIGLFVPRVRFRESLKRRYLQLQRNLWGNREEKVDSSLELLDSYFHPHNQSLFKLLERDVVAWNASRRIGGTQNVKQ